MIFAIAAVALDLIVGFGALVSFGHAAFIGLGAYAVGILASHGIGDGLIALTAAIAVSALFAAVTGAICLRTKGVYFIMITLAFGQMAFFTASSLAPYGGDDGLTVANRNTIFGLKLFDNERAFYVVVLVALLGTYALCRAVVASRFGRVLRGTRENPTRMATLGFDTYRYQLAAYVLAGVLAGISGFFLANSTEFVSPAYMSWQRSGELIVMVILGGVGTLHGAIIGTAAYLLDRGMARRLYRALEGDLRPSAGADRGVRARRPHRAGRARLEAPPWLSRCCACKACARASAGSSSPTTWHSM